MHDYFSGMICLRDGGSQMSSMIHKYSNKGIYRIYNVFVCLLLLLVGAVFIYTPATSPPPESSVLTAPPPPSPPGSSMARSLPTT